MAEAIDNLAKQTVGMQALTVRPFAMVHLAKLATSLRLLPLAYGRVISIAKLADFGLRQAAERLTPSLLPRWAKLAGNLQMSDNLRVGATSAMATAGQRFANDRYLDLDLVLSRWDERFAPIGDPFKLDFGLNRWLAAEREEAYSDWIAWILQELGRRRTELLLLGDEAFSIDGDCKTDREIWVPEGHEGQHGRLDCVVYFPDTVMILEMKMGPAATADTAKHKGYLKWLKDRQEARKIPILLATDSNDNDACGFKILRWNIFCKRLRNLIPELVREGHLILAVIASAFIGAVEQNILGFPAVTQKTRPSSIGPKIDNLIEYLMACEKGSDK